jgi:hypothetical protein
MERPVHHNTFVFFDFIFALLRWWAIIDRLQTRGLFGSLEKGETMQKFALGLAMVVLCGFSRFTFADSANLGLPTSLGIGGTPGADPEFIFSFAGPGVGGFGTLDATSNGNGTFTATTGSVTVTSSGDGFTGTLPLFANPSPTGYVTSPSGYFYYDDQLLPAGDPLVTNPGLLFSSLPTPGFEINIYSNAPDDYIYYDNRGYNAPVTFTLAEVGNDVIASQSAPLPASSWAGLGLFGVVAAFRLKRRLCLI